MNKKITIITIIIGLIILTAGIILSLNISVDTGTTSEKEEKEVPPAAKKIVNGKTTNIDMRISKSRIYEKLEIKDSIIYINEEIAYFQTTVKNPTDKKIEKKRVYITFYMGKDELGKLECFIPETNANESISFECSQPVPSIIDATDFKITKKTEE